ncbi:MAG: C_GCAxxG_C_C family protein [Desulfobacula sp.]|nr:C_GCAxxG_C_C family protein [Desulfobacula sp.]
MIERQEDRVLKAFTGLEGGMVASGSTCGVVTGGALGLALMHDNVLKERGIAAEVAVLSLIGEYIRWFEESFGSSFCRERSGVDFYTTMGQLRYFLPGDRVGKCLWHIRGAMRQLHIYQEKDLPGMGLEPKEIQSEPIHCAQAVLRGIRDRTGIGDPLLERLSFIFDGGVGLQGGICGALAGAVMGINLLLGMDIRDTSYFQTLKAFVVGHINLLLEKPIGEPEPFGVGKSVVQRFRKEAGATECHTITEKAFSDWNNFQGHISSSDKCTGLIELATTEASNAIKRLI